VTEAIFPLLGALFVVVFILPLFALLAKLCVVLIERAPHAGPLHGLNRRFLLVTGSSALPLAWLFSAGLHQAETGKSVLACLFDHDAAAVCLEAGFFALTLGLVVIVRAWPTIRQAQKVRRGDSSEAVESERRIERLVQSRAMLRGLAGKLFVTDEAGITIGTQGWLVPRVFVGSAFVTQLSDEMLAGALAHEAEHVWSRDPLRYLLLQLALAVNPVGRFLLEPHVARWHAAREAHCDREAVIGGSSPLSLADAIVLAARPVPMDVAALGTPDTAVLKFRIGMLLAFAEQRPGHCRRSPSPLPAGLALMLVALMLPHQAGTAPLDALHTGAEHAITYFWR
jgi:Zn-dependent protease with chaperone function